MSYGQLFPHGTVPSAGIATAGWDYGPGFDFTTPAPAGHLHGTTFKDFQRHARLPGAHPRRLVPAAGRHRLLRRRPVRLRSLVGAAAGVGPLFQIDNACGPTGKAVYDAAQIADPEIDYSDYDTDKDGVVDFFMMVFAGARRPRRLADRACRRTTTSGRTPRASSSRTPTRTTGLKGYISDDQLKDLEGGPLYYTNALALDDDDDVTAVPGLRARRPVQRQPRVGHRQARA